MLLTLKKPKEQQEFPFLVFHVAQLGINTKVRKYDMCATTFINKITMKCLEFKGQSLYGAKSQQKLSHVSCRAEPALYL